MSTQLVIENEANQESPKTCQSGSGKRSGKNLEINVEEEKQNWIEPNQSTMSQNPETNPNPTWDMFQIIGTLGEGAYGKVYKVKCLKSQLISGENKILTPTMRMRKKLTKGMIGLNMGNQISSRNQMRELMQDQQYVIKEIDTSKMPKEVALKQLMEIEMLGELESPFIVGYYDSFIQDTMINIIMEYCQNGDLESFIQRQNGKPLTENLIWKVFIQMCLGVYYLHSKNIIHRDLKTLNVMLSKDNSAKLGDFGAAKKVEDQPKKLDLIEEEVNWDESQINEETLKKQKSRVGTPFFLAPEAWEDKAMTKKSDIWSLGVILYELCVQKYPFLAQTIDELQVKVQREKYAPIPQTVNKQFCDIIQKCLMKKPENRPSIEEIIFTENFQSKAKLFKISLPLEVNKDKIIQKLQSNQSVKETIIHLDKSLLDNIRVSEFQKPLPSAQKKAAPKQPFVRSTTSVGQSSSGKSPKVEMQPRNPFDISKDCNQEELDPFKKPLATPSQRGSNSFKGANTHRPKQTVIYQQFAQDSSKGGHTNRSKRNSNANSTMIQQDSARPSKTARGQDNSKDLKVNASTLVESNPFGLPEPVQYGIGHQVHTQSRNNGVCLQKSEVLRKPTESNDEFKSQKEANPKISKQTSNKLSHKPTIEVQSPPKRNKKLLGSFVNSSDIHTPFTQKDEYQLQPDNSPGKKGKGLFSSQVSANKKTKEPDSKYLPPTKKTPQQNFLKKNASQALLPKRDLTKVDSKMLPSKYTHRGSGKDSQCQGEKGGKHNRHQSSNFIKVEQCADGRQSKMGKINDLDNESVQKINSVQNIVNKVAISQYKIEGFTKSTQPEYDQNEEDEFFDHMLKEKDLETLLMDFPMEELYLDDQDEVLVD